MPSVWTWYIALCLCFYVILPFTSYASRSLSITTDKTSVFGEEELTLTASLSGFTEGETVYVKGAFLQKDSSGTNYFGYTKYGDSWIKNGESASVQRAVIIGNWDKKVTVKSDFSDGGYKGEGDYILKLGYYYVVSGGSISGVKWSSNTILISISEPDPTPTNSSTPTVEPTSTETPTPSSTKTPTPTQKLTISPSPTNMVKEEDDEAISSSSGIEKDEDIDILEDENGSFTSDHASKGAVIGASSERKNIKPIVQGLLMVSAGSALLSVAWVLKHTGKL